MRITDGRGVGELWVMEKEGGGGGLWEWYWGRSNSGCCGTVGAGVGSWGGREGGRVGSRRGREGGRLVVEEAGREGGWLERKEGRDVTLGLKVMCLVH